MVPSTFSSKTSKKDLRVASTGMMGDVLPNSHQTESLNNSNSIARTIAQSQEIVYSFLLSIVNSWPPEAVLQEFKQLFVYYDANPTNTSAIKALSNIIFDKNEEEFKNTLKRSCYILINNWDSSRHFKYIGELVELFSEFKINKKTLSPTLSLVRLWLANFAASQDYQELQLFAAKYDNTEKVHWSHNYTSYLLVPQYVELKNPIEQREAARALSQQLKDRFKFDLAMYTARSQSAICGDKIPKNPTHLGEEVLRLIKTMVARKGQFSYTNLANIFTKQTEQMLYRDFKQSLKKYLLFSIQNQYHIEVLEQKLSESLETLYEDYHDEVIDSALLLRTCNRIIEYLTTEDKKEPSQVFILLMSHGNPLTLVIVLLKIILICRNARTHLESRIAELIQYYIDYPEEECKWIINFLDVFNIVFAVHADNVRYNLIKVGEEELNQQEILGKYRIFSQQRADNL